MQTNQQHRPSSIALISIFLVVVSHRAAHAQSSEAEALFDDGNRLMSERKLAQACDAFEASNRIESRAGTLIRLGECREQNQQLASAWSAFKDALARAKDPRKREIASARVAELEHRLSYLTVSVSDENRVEGLTVMRAGKPLDPVLWNRRLPVDGGDYVIAGSAPGHEDWQSTVHVPTEGARLGVAVPRLHELKTSAPVRWLPVVSSSGMRIGRKVALGLAGVTVIGAAIGIVLGNSARENQGAAYQRCPDPAMPCAQADQAQALIHTGQRRALETNVAFGIAAAAAIGAGVLWFSTAPDSRDTGRVAIVPDLFPGRAEVSIMGRF